MKNKLRKVIFAFMSNFSLPVSMVSKYVQAILSLQGPLDSIINTVSGIT